ncbi:hypothetical protein GCM10010123_40360 [Pilimelia anulata]|uniref:Plasmid pRiA4b Orf3-like domain-containing protein n=1 Tax=Pilimelia anulata TaxID=53371 RepID=A0A8J3BDQ8_9ACTN|nr:hypothetical protein [Pilimelia anulata]GGK06456.1 hypothetical protein GCM10010123_40360 [Pilimelia anulata]
MARTWLSIKVELVSGRGNDYWPRPGRIMAAARSHTFEQLAEAIDDAFARWDRAHLHLFTLADGTPVSPLHLWDGEAPDGTLDGRTSKLSRLRPGEQFAYVFDLGDDWAHLCTVAEQRIDPLDELGVVPQAPMPFWGWGDIPDQYGRAWDADDGETPAPKRPGRPLADLPPILPWWGPQRQDR